MTLTVREGRAGDAAQLVALLNPIIAAGGWAGVTQPLSLADIAGFIAEFAKGAGVLLVAEDGGRIVGMQHVPPMERKTGEFVTFVAADLRRKGIGRALTDAILPLARAKGIETVQGIAQPNNPTALAFGYAMDFKLVKGGYPKPSIMERSTEVIQLTPEQQAVVDILAKHFNTIQRRDDAAIVAQYGQAAFDKAKQIVAEGIDAPVNWRTQSMDQGIAILGKLMAKRYPWLTPKARASVTHQFVMTYK